MTSLQEDLSDWVWESRYRWQGVDPPADLDVQGTRARVAAAVAAVAAAESDDRTLWDRCFRCSSQR